MGFNNKIIMKLGLCIRIKEILFKKLRMHRMHLIILKKIYIKIIIILTRSY
jgi:hypothetical protein